MSDTYLRDTKLTITYLDYDDSRCETMIMINGKPMTIEQFRALKASSRTKNHIGMGIWVTKKEKKR